LCFVTYCYDLVSILNLNLATLYDCMLWFELKLLALLVYFFLLHCDALIIFVIKVDDFKLLYLRLASFLLLVV
jgi:hypothetical protein